MKIDINRQHKSIPRGLTFELPSFCIITGKNGSGKSHLLEAIENTEITKISDNDFKITNILHIRPNELVPQLAESCHSSHLSDYIYNFWAQIENIIQAYNRSDIEYKGAEEARHFLAHYAMDKTLHSTITQILKDSEKELHEITKDDVIKNISYTNATQNSLFNAQLAIAIKSYSYRKGKNEFAEFLASRNGDKGYAFLSQDKFIEKYGPPPWELINDILARANLPYEITWPDLDEFELLYNIRLIDKTNGTDITLDELSSGEKVLMSLAIAIYTTTTGGNYPELLLLDEPDAPLHPQFSRSLIEILNEVIVKQAGIRVIMTTHSPSTVAMAPERSIFEINKTTRTPFAISNAEAIRKLSSGVDFLHVSFESRRQIFVESKFDVVYFENLFDACSRLHSFTFQPIFIEPHSGDSNCTDVKKIVNTLRLTGNDLVWGIIDYDTTNKSTDSIILLGGGTRYAIENYILEPLYICFCLIRHSKKTFLNFGVNNEKKRFTDIPNLSQIECQTMIDNLLTQADIALDDLVPTKLENGFEINYPRSFLLCKGHDYETTLNNTFPELAAIARNKGDAALKLGVLETIVDYPQFLPIEISETFFKILGLDTQINTKL